MGLFVTLAVALLGFTAHVSAGFDANAQSNVAIYWGTGCTDSIPLFGAEG
jgi:hypothetical protein